MEKQEIREFVHEPEGFEARSISGSYRILKEEVLSIKGRDLLYLVAAASFDSSCCGTGGCAYALVPGFLAELKTRRNREGKPVSLVSPIRDDKEKEEIAEAIKAREPVLSQIQFL